MKRVYLANPYGFSKQQKVLLLPEIIRQLEAPGLEVWSRSRQQLRSISRPRDGLWVGQKDYSDVRESDATFAIVNGMPPDGGDGRAGMAIALQKPTFLFRDDFRRCTDSEEIR